MTPALLGRLNHGEGVQRVREGLTGEYSLRRGRQAPQIMATLLLSPTLPTPPLFRFQISKTRGLTYRYIIWGKIAWLENKSLDSGPNLDLALGPLASDFTSLGFGFLTSQTRMDYTGGSQPEIPKSPEVPGLLITDHGIFLSFQNIKQREPSKCYKAN